MTEKEELLAFLDKTKTQYTIFSEPQFIDDLSVKKGAVISVSVRNAANFNFDSEGNLIGTSTDTIKSHILRGVVK
jgi:hypothetical protein